MSTVQNKEVSTFERSISSKNCSGDPKGVHNTKVSTLERCPHKEVLLDQIRSFILFDVMSKRSLLLIRQVWRLTVFLVSTPECNNKESEIKRRYIKM